MFAIAAEAFGALIAALCTALADQEPSSFLR